jgi:hypothetical protein
MQGVRLYGGNAMLLHTQGRLALSVVTIVAGWGFAGVAAAGPGDQKFSIDFGLSFPSPDHDVTGSSAGTLQFWDSGSNGSTITSLGIDYRLRLDSLINGGVNGANGANGQVTPPLTPLGPVAGAWGRVFLGGDDQNQVKFDFHPNAGSDTFSYYSRDWFFLPYVGYAFSLGEIGGRAADLTIFGGPRIEQRKVKLMTNELGIWSTFSDTETDLGFTFGFDVDFALWALFGNVGNVGNVGNTNAEPFFRFGAALDYNPNISLSGRSTGQSFDYDDEVESSFEPRIFVGFGVKF